MASWDDEIDLPFTDDEGEFRYSDYDLLSFSMLSTGSYQYCRLNFLYRYWFIIYADLNTSKLKLRQCTCKSKSITG